MQRNTAAYCMQLKTQKKTTKTLNKLCCFSYVNNVISVDPTLSLLIGILSLTVLE